MKGEQEERRLRAALRPGETRRGGRSQAARDSAPSVPFTAVLHARGGLATQKQNESAVWAAVPGGPVAGSPISEK